jgi:RNA polymerase sigma factor (TIGR02999 family)
MSRSNRPPDGDGDLTLLLRAWSAGESQAAERLLPLVYDDLRRRAARQLRRERPGHSLRPTALVHEAWLRLREQRGFEPGNRERFLGLAAQAIRRILVDHARSRRAQKRGGGRPRVELADDLAAGAARDEEVLALDEALDRLRARHERQARVVELRHFGGLDVTETARVTSHLVPMLAGSPFR